MSMERAEEFIQRFATWAQAHPDILAVALVGSHARAAARPDSDIDLVLICARSADYLADLSWTLHFGAVREHQLEDYGKIVSIRAWYEGGLEVEYGITDEDWAALPLDEGTRHVISDGMVVLYEQGDLLSRHQRADLPRKPVPKAS
jgi:uncharacterized protein